MNAQGNISGSVNYVVPKITTHFFVTNTQPSVYNASFNFSDPPETPSVDDVFGPQYHSRVRISIILVMIAFSLTGNSMVCWKLLRRSRRHRYSKAQVLFLNLAIADLLVTTVTMTSQTVWEIMGRVWVAGDAFCRLFKVLQTFALASSTYMLISIALDRHFAIVSPLARCPGPWKLAIAAWISALVPSVPNLLVFRLVDVGSGVSYCASRFYADETPLIYRQLYMAFVFLIVFIVPLFLLIGLYCDILVEIWRQSAAAKCRQQTASSLPKAKVKTLKMTVVVFGAFIVTNVPYMVQEMILAFAGQPGILNRNVVALFGVISASNSAINPYIFLFFGKKRTSRFTTGFSKRMKSTSRQSAKCCCCCWQEGYWSSFRTRSSMSTVSTLDCKSNPSLGCMNGVCASRRVDPPDRSQEEGTSMA